MKLKLLPYDKFELIVKLPGWEVQKRLLENVPERKFFSGMFDEPKAFKGKIEETTFKIYRNIWYRNSGLPVLHGNLEECKSGTKITITMKLHGLVQLILVAFCGFEIKSLIAEGIKNYSFEFVFVFVVAVIIFGGFWFENRLSKSAFLELFKDEIITANQEDTPGQNAAR